MSSSALHCFVNVFPPVSTRKQTGKTACGSGEFVSSKTLGAVLKYSHIGANALLTYRTLLKAPLPAVQMAQQCNKWRSVC